MGRGGCFWRTYCVFEFMISSFVVAGGENLG